MVESLKSGTGTVVSVSAPKTSVKGDQFIRLDIDGEWFSIWKPSEDFDVLVGDTVKYSYLVQGDFKNIKMLEIVGKVNLKDAGRVSDVSCQDASVDFKSADSIDSSKRVEEDIREIKYKLSLILEILRQKFDIDIE